MSSSISIPSDRTPLLGFKAPEVYGTGPSHHPVAASSAASSSSVCASKEIQKYQKELNACKGFEDYLFYQLKLAHQYFQEGDYPTSLHHYSIVLNGDPDHREIRSSGVEVLYFREIAEASYRVGEEAFMATFFKKTFESMRRPYYQDLCYDWKVECSPEFILNGIEVFLKLEDDKAAAFYFEYYVKHPNRPAIEGKLFAQIAIANYRIKNYSKAALYFTEAQASGYLISDHLIPMMHEARGLKCLENGRHQEANEHFQAYAQAKQRLNLS